MIDLLKGGAVGKRPSHQKSGRKSCNFISAFRCTPDQFQRSQMPPGSQRPRTCKILASNFHLPYNAYLVGSSTVVEVDVEVVLVDLGSVGGGRRAARRHGVRDLHQGRG